jgi:hypothetical protein
MKAFIGLLIASSLTCFSFGYLIEAKADVNSSHFHTHHDTIPNFAQNPTIQSAQNGSWFNTNTWNPKRLPNAQDVVLIRHAVAYDSTAGDVDTIGIAAAGVLRFSTSQSTRLKVATLLVQPGGILEIGTSATPIPSRYTAEIIIKDKPLDTTNNGVGVYDPEQWGTALLVVDGTVRIHGAAKSPTFVRLAKEPRAGDTTLLLATPVSGWRAGDLLILPDTRLLHGSEKTSFVPQWEELTIQSISGTTVTLTAPLKYDHLGARNANNVLEFLPHIGNLSRNVIVRSENAAGTRGHVAALHNADVDIRYGLFKDLGRTTVQELDNTTFNTSGTVSHLGTNQIGRYMLHMHHVSGKPDLPANVPQLTLWGNALNGGEKWGIALHGTHYSLVQQNVVYNVPGAGIVTEDGSESYNVFEENFTVANRGSGEPPYDRTNIDDFGHEGAGFWFRGPNNYVRNNVAANALRPGFAFVGIDIPFKTNKLGQVVKKRIPAYKGANPNHEGQYVEVNVNALPVLDFNMNEAYGAMEDGLLLWEIGAKRFGILPQHYEDDPMAGESTFRNMRVWHVFNTGFHARWVNNITLEDFVVRSDHRRGGTQAGVAFTRRMARNITVRRADIQGAQHGVESPNLADEYMGFGGGDAGPMTIEDSHLQNYINLYIETPYAADQDLNSTGGPQNVPPRAIVVRNTRFVPYDFWVRPLGSPQAIVMAANMSGGFERANLIVSDTVKILRYNQVSGDDFQVYYKEQAPTVVVPQTHSQLYASPEAGLTNQQNWAKYKIAIAGVIAPCLKTRSEIQGFVCALSGVTGDTTPPAAPSNLKVSVQ